MAKSPKVDTPAPPFKLTPIEKDSGTWTRLSEHLSTRLEQLRTRLEKTLPETETAKLRGQVAEIRTVLSFADDEQPTLAWADGDGGRGSSPLTREQQLDKFRS